MISDDGTGGSDNDDDDTGDILSGAAIGIAMVAIVLSTFSFAAWVYNVYGPVQKPAKKSATKEEYTAPLMD